MQTSNGRRSFVGAGIFAAWVLVPGVLGLLAARFEAWTIAAVLWVPWSLFIFPHGSTWLPAGTGAQRAWSYSVAIILAAAQWSIAAVVFGWKTRADSPRARFWTAPAVVIAIAIAARLVLHLCGYTVEVDGP